MLQDNADIANDHGAVSVKGFVPLLFLPQKRVHVPPGWSDRAEADAMEAGRLGIPYSGAPAVFRFGPTGASNRVGPNVGRTGQTVGRTGRWFTESSVDLCRHFRPGMVEKSGVN